MAYDEDLAHRLRTALEGVMGISEKRMMGGQFFFLDGNMVGGAYRDKSGEGLFMFRVGKRNEQPAMQRESFRLSGRGQHRMRGFFTIAADACDTAELGEWVSLALSFVCTLPPKNTAEP